MKIFESKKSNKYNFVDKNNVLVGYDKNQICCEEAFWILTSSETLDMEKITLKEGGNRTMYSEVLLNEFMFDTTYFTLKVQKVKVNFNLIDLHNYVSFKLINTTFQPIYLHLVNLHSGMYYHGFTCEINGERIHKGMI